MRFQKCSWNLQISGVAENHNLWLGGGVLDPKGLLIRPHPSKTMYRIWDIQISKLISTYNNTGEFRGRLISGVENLLIEEVHSPRVHKSEQVAWSCTHKFCLQVIFMNVREKFTNLRKFANTSCTWIFPVLQHIPPNHINSNGIRIVKGSKWGFQTISLSFTFGICL